MPINNDIHLGWIFAPMNKLDVTNKHPIYVITIIVLKTPIILPPNLVPIFNCKYTLLYSFCNIV